MIETTANYDDTWKEAIELYFDKFLEFFFPEVYKLVDWNQKPISLDKELQQIIASSNITKRHADKLFQVWLKDQLTIRILVHIEVQSQYDSDFAQRMFVYNYRVFDFHQKPVISLAILGDERKSWRPNNYNYSLGGCEVSIKFPIVKLLDYKWEELDKSNNLFAKVVMAHLKTKATTKDFSERAKYKWQFIKGLYEEEFSKKDIVQLFKFLDIMMTLPPELQDNLDQKIHQYEEERKMPLLTNIERKALAKGEVRGTRETSKKYIVSILQKRFEVVSPDLIQAINNIEDIPLLQNLVLETISVDSIEEFQHLINEAN